MLIEQKLLAKLQPHADRIAAGNNNDFDYLPAVFLEIIQGQKRQILSFTDISKTVSSKFDESEVSLSSIKEVGLQSLQQVNQSVTLTNQGLDDIAQKLVDTDRSIAALAMVTKQVDQAVRLTNQGLDDIAQNLVDIDESIAALAAASKLEHKNIYRLLFVSLTGTLVAICLGAVVLLRL
jgi:methyl-accepting chemotaxis protein